MIQCVYSLRVCMYRSIPFLVDNKPAHSACSEDGGTGCEERFCPWLLRIINGIHTRSEMTGC
ncbi:hypothetical protein DMI60_24590 [Escherichia coli]|nr:hypothetical protein [Escherichia coli]